MSYAKMADDDNTNLDLDNGQAQYNGSVKV